MAKLRCVAHNALLLLASATPSVESRYKAQQGKYHYFELKERYALSLIHILWYDLEQSLDALQTDYIDLYWLHRDHLSTSVEEIVDTLNEFADKGLVRCFGVSNWTTERLLEANTYAKRAGKLGFSASQIQWSLAACTPQTWGDDTLVCMTDQIRADYLRPVSYTHLKPP